MSSVSHRACPIASAQRMVEGYRIGKLVTQYLVIMNLIQNIFAHANKFRDKISSVCLWNNVRKVLGKQSIDAEFKFNGQKEKNV